MLFEAYGQGLFMPLLKSRYTFKAHAAKAPTTTNCHHATLGQADNAGEGLLSAT